ncbi:histidine kinase [Cellulosimicrobium sp. Marseille-Q4280]|uniref:sensor histidine kinase n=1 Tax=Cellulosimicrobium sp. Marseille-Q4280 TaxID=2937992 RepID=UPI00203D2649|nr:histidine kinase [Cellulosimicrobium sp. Marseille-Q4280]
MTRGTRPGGGDTARRLTAPLRSASTVRAGVYLVIGGVVAGAYLVLVTGFVQMFASTQTPRVAAGVLAVLSAVIAGTPPFLAPVRALEIAAVRTFLDVDLPTPAGDANPSAATRWRAAAWYALHLALGAAVLVVVLLAIPVATQLVLSALGIEPVLLGDWRPWELVPSWADTWALALIAVVLLLLLPYVIVAARELLRQAAWPLLGPDQLERIAELEVAADRDAERGRLARELHDSVGHALTVTTLQAAAASRLLATDPEAARRALAAIEETGRSAMADLDHVLGLLRADGTGTGPRSPARTLADLPALLDDARRAGADVVLVDVPERPRGLGHGSVRGTEDARLVDVPRATSQEAYRVVQEALTNALRHAPGAPVTVTVGIEGAELLGVEVRNPLPEGPAPPPDGSRPARSGGRGVTGMRERARLLRGEVDAGPASDGGTWLVRAAFPLRRSGA